jgi:hypothetical protein
MTSLADHHSSNFVKLLYLGDAKSGKTTSLASLVTAGYKLRILDFDNLLDTFAQRVRKVAPDKLSNVEYRPLRDKFKPSTAGMILDGKPRAWIDSLKMLNEWKYTDEDTGEVIDLGSPSEWGPDTILVIDSLSRWCDSAYNFHEVMIPKGKSGEADGRAIYGNAQDDVEKQLAALTSKRFATNVIVICHGVYQTLPDGNTKIFPQGVGQKLSPKIPQYFPNYLRITKRGEKREIQLKSDLMIDLANTRPDALSDRSLDPETGLAEFFAVLRGQTVEKAQSEPKKPALRKI